LRVGFLREDGYHDTTMVWQAISLYDNLLISHNPHGPSMTVTGIDNERMPTDSREFGDQNGPSSRDELGIEPQLHFELAKSIPQRLAFVVEVPMLQQTLLDATCCGKRICATIFSQPWALK
jgi:4-diphosphocytidyl-2C-methyl-D-erythritol kinase